MGSTSFTQGQVVRLLAELRTDDRIHEIGTSARVVAADAVSVRLELGGREIASCPCEHVTPAATRGAGARSGRSRAAYRPAIV